MFPEDWHRAMKRNSDEIRVNMSSDVYRDSEMDLANILGKPDAPQADDARLQRNSYSWTAMAEYSHLVMAFVIQRFIRQIQSDMLVLRRENSAEFTYDYQKKTSILTDGSIAFSHRDKVFVYTVATETHTPSNTLTGSGDISEMVERINREIKWNNPLRNKHIQIVQSGRREYECLFKKPPDITLDQIICDPQMKEDIFDQTILHFETIKGNNGIILHGKPGTGKSLCCQAIIAEALKRGFSTCFLTTQVNYAILNEFLTKFLSPCIVVMEDIDSFGESREFRPNSDLADFLQFISGLYEHDEKIVFVATTNHIEYLDEAIAERPVRFNRKYKFNLPTPKEIDQLIELYFKGEGISQEQKALCYNKRFTGSHIKEIQRTAELLSRKHQKPIAEVFEQAVRIVAQNFSIPERSAGFRGGKREEW
ncbi:MAG: ATP-binding protein [Chloroherpetonaceae bacterium]|nr:ATP-binding protein [Chloroherpetonaceae bacterium]